MTRTISHLFASAALLLAMGLVGCDGQDGGDSNSTTNASAGTAETGGGESGESGESGGSEGMADTDPDCPLGSFDCPCDNGMCAEGLTCGPDGLCALGGSETGNPTTTSAGDTTETTTSSGPTSGGASGSVYDPEECEAPSEVLSVEQIEGEFCAAPCVDHEECPEGPSGTTASCSISTVGGMPNFCVLICMPGSEDCPTGSTCKAVPQQPTVGLCTYP